MIARVEAGNKISCTCDLQENWPQHTTPPQHLDGQFAKEEPHTAPVVRRS